MVRVKFNILGISELKRTRMGKFSSDDHYIYYCGQESLRRNGVALPHSQQESEMQIFGAVSKMTEWSRFVYKANHSVIQVYAPTNKAEEAEAEQFYENLQHLLEITTK